jgi:hypothetical protein
MASGGGCLHDTFLQVRAALREENHWLDPEELASLTYQKGETEAQKRLRATQAAKGAAS